MTRRRVGRRKAWREAPFASAIAFGILAVATGADAAQAPASQDKAWGIAQPYNARNWVPNVARSRIVGVQEVTDLSLPCPTFGWRHTRVHRDSLARTKKNGGLASIQGRRWKVDLLETFILRSGTGNNVTLYLDACSKVDLAYAGIKANVASYTSNTRTAFKHYRAPAGLSGTAEAECTKRMLRDRKAKYPAPDGLAGCVLKVNVNGEDELRRIKSNTETTVQVSDEFSDKLSGKGYHILGQFTFRIIDTGQVYRFRDCDVKGYKSGWRTNEQGLIWERTDVYDKKHNRYVYSEATIPAGRIEAIILSSGYRAKYTYATKDPDVGRIQELEVVDTSKKALCAVLYTYFGKGMHKDVGAPGDLVLIQQCRSVALSGTAGDGSTTSDLKIQNADRTVKDHALAKHKLVMRTGTNQFRVRTIQDNDATSITVSPSFGKVIDKNDKFWVTRKVRAYHYRYH